MTFYLNMTVGLNCIAYSQEIGFFIYCTFYGVYIHFWLRNKNAQNYGSLYGAGTGTTLLYSGLDITSTLRCFPETKEKNGIFYLKKA